MLFTSGKTMSTANPNANVSLNVDEVAGHSLLVKEITCSVIMLNWDQTDSLNKNSAFTKTCKKGVHSNLRTTKKIQHPSINMWLQFFSKLGTGQVLSSYIILVLALYYVNQNWLYEKYRLQEMVLKT